VKTLLKIALTLLPVVGYTQSYTTFAVKVNAPDSILQSIPRSTIEDAISIHSLKKDTASPSLIVSFTVQDLVINAENIQQFAATKDSSFYVEVLYSLKCEGACHNAQNQQIYSGHWGLGQSKYVSAHMPTRQAAEDYWKNNKESLKANFIDSIIYPSLAAMGNKLNATFP